MSGDQVRTAREHLGLTQQQAARRWKLSQTYVSLVEHGKRPAPDRLARLLARTEPSMATGLPLKSPVTTPDDLPRLLGALGYPGFMYLADPRNVANPAAVVLAALRMPVVPARVTEALPWLLVTFTDLDWSWLLDQAKLSNVQNRLGFLVSLGKQVAEQRGDTHAVARLTGPEQALEEARLAKEDTLGRELTDVERGHLRQHRPASATHWNLLTSLRVEDLRHGL
jgi:transcriptional regulator with XRE-family HTH domain